MISALQEGPIVCGMYITEQFEALHDFNVYIDSDTHVDQQLAVSIVGYGTTADGIKYWIGRSSWGDYFAAHGFFRIVRGINNLGIETQCTWARPETAPYSIQNATDNGTQTTQLQQSYPDTFSWSNVNGTNFVTPVRNQNVPDYCLSDWAFAVTSMMSDRLNVQRTVAWPEIMFSVQSLLNLPGGKINANCYGCRDLHSVMKYIEDAYIPIESCQLYIGNDESPGSLHVCEYCSDANNPKSCHSVSNFTAYTFEKWGSISGENEMRESILEYGPIVCGMDATPSFKQYTSGIFQQFLFSPMINHYVEVIGWGQDSNASYWIGKNSWGQNWGELGLFRIQTKTNNLGIETDCYYGIPKEKQLSKKEIV